MTVGESVARANAFLNILRGTTYTGVTPYIQLHTADPGAAGTTGISAGSATRVLASFAAASGGSIALSAALAAAWTNGGTTETITHISIWDSLSGGVFQRSVALTTPQPWVATNQFSLNSLTGSLSPIAA